MIQKILKTIFIIVLLSITTVFAFEFKVGEYKLVKGDDNFCEDGMLSIRDGTLFLGTRFIFTRYIESEFKFLNDSKSCEYSIINSNSKASYVREMIQTCKDLKLNGKRKFTFKNGNNQTLLLDLEIDHKKYQCELKFTP
jgi:hypothetical protein